jgi:Zn-dependent protease with chaperone function
MFSGRLFRESVLMKKSLAVSVLAAAVLLAGCQSVNTTSGGAVGVERKQYMFSMLSSQEVDQMYAQSYQQTLGEASGKGLVDKTSANAKRVQAIAKRLIAQAPTFRADAAQWNWEVNLIKSDEMNANCGPGGKIFVYSALIDNLKLTDDELAAVMGHEIAMPCVSMVAKPCPRLTASKWPSRAPVRCLAWVRTAWRWPTP